MSVLTIIYIRYLYKVQRNYAIEGGVATINAIIGFKNLTMVQSETAVGFYAQVRIYNSRIDFCVATPPPSFKNVIFLDFSDMVAYLR